MKRTLKGAGDEEVQPAVPLKRPQKSLHGQVHGIPGVIRDVAISASIVALILVSLYAYAGIWPPMVVIESNSMMHGDDSQVGIIDTGDLTLVKSIRDRQEVVTYVEASCSTNPHHGFKTYGDYGNVIIYRKNGLSETPVIHRAMAWIVYNASASDPNRGIYRGDLPDIGIFDVAEYTITHVGYMNQTVTIRLSDIFAASATSTSRSPHSGFVTKGDHNPRYVDQEVLRLQSGGRVEPAKVDWVVGKSEGELPWFGIFKLWITGHNSSTFPKSSVQDLVIVIVLLIAVPICIDVLFSYIKKRMAAREGTGKDKERKKPAGTDETGKRTVGTIEQRKGPKIFK